MNSQKKIAVVGLACRFPGANNIDELWKVLIEGKDTITHFTDEELEKYEYDFESLKKNPDFVGAKGIIKDIDKFDASFFGYTPKEAEGMDPQFRVWLETVWIALENAGCDPLIYKGKIGVFAGGSMNTYLLNNILRNPKTVENYIRTRTPESFQTMIGNEVSMLPTKTAYKLNLRGPAINIQTACSTSLVGISMACNSLLSGESDMGIAGGVSIFVPQETGYIYQEGAISSPDGCCRTFDSKAKGAVFSNGVGVAVLKRLDDAIRDGDIIYSVVTGWALNNDGNNKVSYVAPSIDGQAEVIEMAQTFAGISPEDIGYIEAHGTATLLGDPVELAGLSKAFSLKTNKKQYCGIGSVKSNIGHTDVAAGIAGFIKASLAAYTKTIPPTIHFSEPNPYFNFKDSPFYVQDKIKKWEEPKPLMIGVSSFGIGGTNVHVIMEEPPVRVKPIPVTSEWPELVLLSAKSEKSLVRKKQEFIEFIEAKPELDIRDVVYSLALGRNHMKYRSFVVASDRSEIVAPDVKFTDGTTDNFISRVAFMFPGQGAQYVSMGKDLYQSNKFFRDILDQCFVMVKSETGEDLKKILFPDMVNNEAEIRLANTEITQPALFIIEYALAKVLMQFDIKPSYLIGHSIGEYTAACIAGVFDLQSAIKIVIMRGKLMQKMPRGEMMAVRTGKDKLESIKANYFEIAADNANDFCTISFKPVNSATVKKLLDENAIQYIPLNTSHSFHSSDFDPILNEFSVYVSQFKLHVPDLPFISCLTGNWITNDQATSASYWAQQLRNTVLFRKGISTIAGADDVAFLEVGPNIHLSPLVKQNEQVTNKKAIISTLGKADTINEKFKIITALGNLYTIGINLNFEALQNGYKPEKIHLPTYPFEKIRCWIDFDLSKVKYNPLDIASTEDTNEPKVEENSTSDSVINLMSPLEKTENAIIGIWKTLFGINEIGPDDNFFDIGGHSLLALQVNNRIKDIFKITVSLKEFQENATIPKISKMIQSKLETNLEDISERAESLIELVHLTETKNLPLTSNQKRLWLISKIDSDVASYIIANSFKLVGALNRYIFQKSLDILFHRHSIVFSVMKEINGEPYCDIVLSEVNISFNDYSGLPEDKKFEKVKELIEADTRKPFDLNKGPLYRLHLIMTAPEEYYFHFSIHHVVFDGWSWSVFANDLSEIYNSLLKGKAVDMKELEFQEYDYAHWEKSSAGVKSEKESMKFWGENLKGLSPMLNFPYDYHREGTLSGRGNCERIYLSEDQSEKLRRIGKTEGASLFTTLFSIFGIQMHKYTGEDDLNIGLPVAHRPHSKLENIFGMFVNTVVVRLKYSKGQTFKDIIRQTNRAVMNAIAHQDLAFDKVVEIINPERSINVNPLFQVAFVWQNNLDKPLNLDGITSENVTLQGMATEFDITLLLWENNNCIEGEIAYNLDILKQETIARLWNNFRILVENLLERSDTPIESVPMISDEERRIIEGFNDTHTDYPKDKTIVQLFEEQANLYPNKTAVVFKESSLTYKQLNEKTNQLARVLKESGVSANTPVGIMIDKSVDMIVGIFGILKAGGCYVPIDPQYPEQRINFIIQDSGCKILLTQKNYNKLYIEGITKFYLDSEKSYHQDWSNMERINIPSDLAYIIYTSGTTGIPKGTLIPHQGMVRLVRNTNYIGFSSEDRVLQTSSIVFDGSTEGIFGALLNGATLFIINKETILNPNKFGEVLVKNNITIVDLTSALFTQIAESRTDIFSTVRQLILGGDVVSAPHVNKVRKNNPQLTVINAYGPTENSCTSTAYRIDKDYDNNIPIGKPISNSKAYIFDKNRNYQPIGIIGELYVGGDGLSKGYLNREDLNNTRFIDNPCNPGERLYKTGDLARWLPDGNIEFHGRIDNQIKIRGYRVELEEIESIISDIEGIIETVVLPVKDERGDHKLVAFINVPETFKMGSNEIGRIIQEKVPPYMVPSAYKFMHGFKKTINGKIDRKALNFDLSELKGKERKGTEDLSPTEKILLDIWCDVLKTKDILSTDNFFEIGGNSLLTISIASKIENIFNINFEIRNFFSTPRIKDLAELIEIKIQSNYFIQKQNDSLIKMIKGEI
jgi:amino acid adenylation domain-containing protein